MKILGAGHYRAERNVHFSWHRHSYWELVYYRTGAVECLTRPAPIPAQAGLYWLTPPEVEHGERAISAYSCYWIALECPWKTRAPTFLDDDRHQSMAGVCRQIVAEWGGQSRGRLRMLRLLAEQLACLLDRAQSESHLAPAEQAVLRAESWMEEHGGQPLSLRTVAREAGVSVSSLRGYFHAVRGCSPRVHLASIRFSRAARFLRTSNLKLEAIAELCGYDSASHLSRHVKKQSGRTPGQLRRA